jgi:ankyrin repeat protein
MDDEGNTALMYAARGGYVPVVKALLKAIASVTKENEGGATALSWAAAAGKTDTLRVLMDRGSNAEAIDDAFVTAAEYGRSEIIRALLDKGADTKKLRDEALLTAASSAKFGPTDNQLGDTVTLLLDVGADVDTRNTQGCTALFLAAESGHSSIVKILSGKTIDINAKCDRPAAFDEYSPGGFDESPSTADGGWTPLAIAIAHNHNQAAEILLDRDVDVNQRNYLGQTALMLAARRDDANLVLNILNKGADINAKTVKGWTALMHAARQGNLEVVRILLKHGAITNAKNVDGKSALQLAQVFPSAETTEVVRTLKEAGAK